MPMSTRRVIAEAASLVCNVEDPVEYALEGIIQIAVNEEIDVTYAKVLRTMELVFDHVQPYPCNAAVYGRPLGFALASRAPIHPRRHIESQGVPVLIDHMRIRHVRHVDAHDERCGKQRKMFDVEVDPA